MTQFPQDPGDNFSKDMRRNSFNIFTGGTKVSKHANGGNFQIWSNNKPSSENNNPAIQPPRPVTDVFQEREGAGGMRVGRDYQARIQPMVPKAEHRKSKLADPDKALLVWCPSDEMTEAKLEDYLDVAKSKFHYTCEQALGLLYWHRYDILRALQDLGNFTPQIEEWTIEDKVLFEQAFQFHGKAFDRIRLMMPDKSMSNLIRYYYKWKKMRVRDSAMDRPEETRAMPTPNSHPNSAHPNNHQPRDSYRNGLHNYSDSDDDIIKRNGESGKICQNCGVPCSHLHTKDNMCNTCFLYWKKTGEYRPLTGPIKRGERHVLGVLRQRRGPPRGMYICHDDLSVLASATPQAENVTLFGLEREVLDMKCRVQTMKQDIEMVKRKLPEGGIDKYRPRDSIATTSSPRVNSRWSQEELLFAAQGIRRYGKDFAKIAEIMQTKNETHLRSFYANYRRRFGLDSLVEEHHLETSDDFPEQDEIASASTRTGAQK